MTTHNSPPNAVQMTNPHSIPTHNVIGESHRSQRCQHNPLETTFSDLSACPRIHHPYRKYASCHRTALCAIETNMHRCIRLPIHIKKRWARASEIELRSDHPCGHRIRQTTSDIIRSSSLHAPCDVCRVMFVRFRRIKLGKFGFGKMAQDSQANRLMGPPG